MKLSDFVRDAQARFGDSDPDILLFDRNRGVELINDPDSNTWDFEVLRGDNCIVIEFD